MLPVDPNWGHAAILIYPRRFKLDIEHIDLRTSLAVLWRWKWLIAGAFILTIIAATVATYLTPPAYEASALVVLSKPLYLVQFDSQITSDQAGVLPKSTKASYELLAKDPALLQQVISVMGQDLPPENQTVKSLNDLLHVREVTPEGIVRLIATHPDPGTARLLADTWARLYAERLNQLYGHNEQDLTTIATQLERARQDWETAQAKLTDFLLHSRGTSLQIQLTVRQNTLNTHLGSQDKLDLILRDAQGLRIRLQQTNVPSMNLSTELAILYLQLGALSVDSPAITLQMPVDQPSFAGASAADQVRYLDEFIVAVQRKKAELGADVSRLEGEILALRAEIEKESAIQKQLTLTRDVAWDTLDSLSRKAAEVRVALELRMTAGAARVTGSAVCPDEPASPNLWRNVGLAAICGLLLGVGCAFTIEYLALLRGKGLAATDEKRDGTHEG